MNRIRATFVTAIVLCLVLALLMPHLASAGCWVRTNGREQCWDICGGQQLCEKCGRPFKSLCHRNIPPRGQCKEFQWCFVMFKTYLEEYKCRPC
jgi:hypothetical protein